MNQAKFDKIDPIALKEEREKSLRTVSDQNGEHMIVNLGPQHPSTHGTLHNILELNGETVVKATPVIGYLHTGFEKLGEHLDYHQFITVTDRMNYLSSMNNNIGFAIAVEELAEVEVPPRAQLLRVILSEMSRIGDHLACVGLQAMDVGAFSVFLWCWKWREKMYDIFEHTTGARLTTSFARIGGLAKDIPEGFEQMATEFVENVARVLDETELMISRNRIFIDRSQGIGILEKEIACSYGVTGPVLRASGVPYDVRKAHPYSGYETFDFEIPTEPDGDSYARYKLRLAEMRQSLRIIQQGMERLPDVQGPVIADDFKMVLPPKDNVYNNMEELIHHFKIVMRTHGPKIPVREFYSSTEVPNGELGWYIISDGGMFPYRIRTRSPSFYNYQVFPYMLEGHMIPDVPAILSTLNVIAGELDR
ncbi:MAG: NADH-quinone oxidoreductase subunit D [Candidatus Cloacimonetes bacterium 4572_55]|nr:MAG: NADH-quinone oxidoreductase subunit D [Candidatus Cloacimonetes bacterium 4572_55]